MVLQPFTHMDKILHQNDASNKKNFYILSIEKIHIRLEQKSNDCNQVFKQRLVDFKKINNFEKLRKRFII